MYHEDPAGGSGGSAGRAVSLLLVWFGLTLHIRGFRVSRERKRTQALPPQPRPRETGHPYLDARRDGHEEEPRA